MTTPRRAPEVLLRRYWNDPDTPVVTAGLSVLSWAYRAAIALRDRAYRLGVLPTGRLPCPVISVGNLTLGGTGKTPTVELVARTLQELGAVPAVLSRGYGRTTRGVQVVADREAILAEAHAGGDEPRLLAERLPGVPVVVGENRYEAGRVAVERCGATALVLDDGFPHRTLAKDLEILVVSGRAPWGNARVFPRGMLREPLAGLRRAHAVLVTNPAGPETVAEVTATVRRHHATAPVLTARYELQDASAACWPSRAWARRRASPTPSTRPGSAGWASWSSPTTTGSPRATWRSWPATRAPPARRAWSPPRRTGCGCASCRPRRCPCGCCRCDS